MVFVDAITGQVLWAKFVKSETNNHYQEGLKYLGSRGFEILGVVSDGRRGLAGIFKDYPYQVCQFHIQKGVSTLLTRNPKSTAGRELKQFNDTFIELRLSKAQFTEQMEIYLKNHQDYLNEMSETDSKQPKHKRLRKAINKYKNNLKYMFTCQNDPQLQIPNTTNKIDGGVFSPLKRLLNNHNGLSKIHRKVWIILFLNSNGKPNT
jgi:Transposase IS66 family